ncbi:MAG: helix-turn-helix domain-containing protein [Oscillospiraceae bacterium]
MQIYQIRIKELRTDNDYTQEQIANYLGIKQTVYSRYETGKNDMKIEYLVKLANFYGVSADYILGLRKGLSWPR